MTPEQQLVIDDATQLIKVYVSESDILSFLEAYLLALKRDFQAAWDLRLTWEAAV